MDMRAKFLITKVESIPPACVGADPAERLEAIAVTSRPFDSAGGNEDNTFAKYTPMAKLEMTIVNPALLGQYKVGMKLYSDFSVAPE